MSQRLNRIVVEVKFLIFLIIISNFIPFSMCFGSNILNAEYSTKYASKEEKRFNSFEELVSYLNKPGEYTKLVRDEFETEAEFKKRVHIFENSTKSSKRFTIHFTPSLGQYSFDKKAFPVKIKYFKGDTASKGWSDLYTRKQGSTVTWFYKKVAGPCIIADWWKRSPLKIIIEPKNGTWAWSIGDSESQKPYTNLLLSISDLDEAKEFRQNEGKLKAAMECIYKGEDFQEESRFHSEDTGRYSSYRKNGITTQLTRCNVRYKQYFIKIEKCTVKLGDKLYEISLPNLNVLPIGAAMFFRNADMKKIDKEIVNRRPSIKITGAVDSDNIKSILIPRTTKSFSDSKGKMHLVTFWEKRRKNGTKYFPSKNRWQRLIRSWDIDLYIICEGVTKKITHERFQHIMLRTYIAQRSYADEINKLTVLKNAIGVNVGSVQVQFCRLNDEIYLFFYSLGSDSLGGTTEVTDPKKTFRLVPENAQHVLNRRDNKRTKERSVKPIWGKKLPI